MMKGRLPLALLGNDRLIQGAWCVGFADIPRFRLAVPTPNLIDPSQVAYRAEPPPTRCAVLPSTPPGSSATHRALPTDTASPATSPRGGICGWVFYLRLECCIRLRTRRLTQSPSSLFFILSRTFVPYIVYRIYFLHTGNRAGPVVGAQTSPRPRRLSFPSPSVSFHLPVAGDVYQVCGVLGGSKTAPVLPSATFRWTAPNVR